ncbi:secreted RxLR effector protein 161-like [Gossypium hirsutum]|uniref:Secreted RxLR effector protein 161-like n=1 Tax=Gossypium hirsutum TaxID=3635 RepID=A0A1U8J708_GOSHI|nr:secreted RxLR effector protein 161-like [Gossypium hirsutum]
MSELGQMFYFFGMEMSQTQSGIFLSQRAFAMKILMKFSVLNCNGTNTPIAIGEKLSSKGVFEHDSEFFYRSLVGCLLYLTTTRPDIMFAMSLLSRFVHCCNEKHFKALKRMLRYIKGSLTHSMLFKKVENFKLIGYANSDWASSIDDMKSTSGYVFTFGSAIFYWSLKKQSIVDQSTVEAKYVAAT